MTKLMRRRRALMGQAAAPEEPWEDVTPSFDSFTPTSSVTKVVDSANQTMRFYTDVAKTYQAVESKLKLVSGYEYRVRYDVDIAKGKHRGSFVAEKTIRAPDSGVMQQSGHVDFVFPYDSTVTGLKLFCVLSTSEFGDVTISSFSMHRRPIT